MCSRWFRAECAVAVTSGGPKNALEHVHFQRLTDQKVLAVVVTRRGLVRDRVLRVGQALSQADLDMASRYINENFRGWTLDDLRAELERRIEQERSEYDRLMRSIEQLYRNGALAAITAGKRFSSKVRPISFRATITIQRLRQLLQALEEKQRVCELSPPIWTHGRKRYAS